MDDARSLTSNLVLYGYSHGRCGVYYTVVTPDTRVHDAGNSRANYAPEATVKLLTLNTSLCIYPQWFQLNIPACSLCRQALCQLPYLGASPKDACSLQCKRNLNLGNYCRPCDHLSLNLVSSIRSGIFCPSQSYSHVIPEQITETRPRDS